MDNVNSGIEFTTQTNHQLNRIILCSAWTRVEKTLIVTAGTISSYRSRQFSVNDQHCTESCQLGHRFAQICFSDIWKLVDSQSHKKTLKPNHPCRKHPRQLRRVSRNNSAPKSDVYKTFISRGFEFRLEVGKRRRRRNRIQRHVDERRNAPCRSGSRRTTKPFPLSSAGSIDVNMRINQPWHYH